MSEGVITHWIEVPILVHYEYQPAERQTRHYPGGPECIVVEDVEFPTPEKLNEIFMEYADEIDEACMEDAK